MFRRFDPIVISAEKHAPLVGFVGCHEQPRTFGWLERKWIVFAHEKNTSVAENDGERDAHDFCP